LAVGLVFFLWEGESYSPHAARLPQMVAGVTLLFLFLDAVSSWRKERGAQKASPVDVPLPKGGPFLESPRFYATACCIIAFFILFPWLGYILSAALFIFGLSWMLGERRWHVLAICSIAAPIAFWYASETYLKIVMPKGVIFEFFLR